MNDEHPEKTVLYKLFDLNKDEEEDIEVKKNTDKNNFFNGISKLSFFASINTDSSPTLKTDKISNSQANANSNENSNSNANENSNSNKNSSASSISNPIAYMNKVCLFRIYYSIGAEFSSEIEKFNISQRMLPNIYEIKPDTRMIICCLF